MGKPKTCSDCKGKGEYWCCDPGTHMCPGLIPCKTCGGSGKVVIVTVKEVRPFRASTASEGEKNE